MSRIVPLLCAVLLLAGCARAETAQTLPTAAVVAVTPASTETPRPTEPPLPTEPPPTATAQLPTPTVSPTDTPSPTVVDDLGLSSVEEIIVDGGFAFRPFLTGVQMEVQPDQAFLNNEDGTFIASLGGSLEADTTNSLDSVLQTLVEKLSDNLGSELASAAAYPIMIGGGEGLATDVAGTLSNDPFLGQVVIVRPYQGQVFFAFGMGNTARGDERWTEGGSRTFATLLNTVRFFPIAPAATAPAGSACPVSTDATYGFTPANAIRVGGDALGGPARASAYLDALRGPAGETVIYQRGGSSSFEGTILDAYAVFYDGAAEPLTLYIDQYAFETLYAPAGFTCAAPFPLVAP